MYIVVSAVLTLWMKPESIRAKNCPNILGVHRHLSDRHWVCFDFKAERVKECNNLKPAAISTFCLFSNNNRTNNC